eukprot:GHVR01142650.1.p1 GENE.GHVR01142650.1~~GHVR01142650.1.p1  ORF type:complete len:141 (+),score=45.21 GHVR01142650.1:291-713(+)
MWVDHLLMISQPLTTRTSTLPPLRASLLSAFERIAQTRRMSQKNGHMEVDILCLLDTSEILSKKRHTHRALKDIYTVVEAMYTHSVVRTDRTTTDEKTQSVSSERVSIGPKEAETPTATTYKDTHTHTHKDTHTKSCFLC